MHIAKFHTEEKVALQIGQLRALRTWKSL